MLRNLVHVLILLVLNFYYCNSQNYDISNYNFEIIEVDRYSLTHRQNVCHFTMDYANSKINNPNECKRINSAHSKIESISIVFTKYPKKKEDWIIHYDTLLRKRIRSIESLLPSAKKI